MRPAPCRGGDLVIPLRTHADFSRQMITDSASILTTYCIVIAHFTIFPHVQTDIAWSFKEHVGYPENSGIKIYIFMHIVC